MGIRHSLFLSDDWGEKRRGVKTSDLCEGVMCVSGGTADLVTLALTWRIKTHTTGRECNVS